MFAPPRLNNKTMLTQGRCNKADAPRAGTCDCVQQVLAGSTADQPEDIVVVHLNKLHPCVAQNARHMGLRYEMMMKY
jgi:hypothetical protein